VVGRDGLRDGDVGHARLDDDALVVEVDLENAPHARKRDQQAVLDWQGPAGEPRAGASRHERHAGLVAGAHDRPHLLGRARHHYRTGRDRVLEQSVGLVGAQLVLVGEDVLRSAGGAQLVYQRTKVERRALRLGLRLWRRALSPRGAGAGGYFRTVHGHDQHDAPRGSPLVCPLRVRRNRKR
jgi:hypothetical protein